MKAERLDRFKRTDARNSVGASVEVGQGGWISAGRESIKNRCRVASEIVSLKGRCARRAFETLWREVLRWTFLSTSRTLSYFEGGCRPY